MCSWTCIARACPGGTRASQHEDGYNRWLPGEDPFYELGTPALDQTGSEGGFTKTHVKTPRSHKIA